MKKESLINETVSTLSKLPEEKIKEVNDFADFILKKYEEEILQKGIETITINSNAFNFLDEEEDLYSVEDLKEQYK
jgi:hypothetical protein